MKDVDCDGTANSFMRSATCWLVLLAACDDPAGSASDAGVASRNDVVINELFAHGQSSIQPDWAELKNIGSGTVDLSGYLVRDKSTDNRFELPSGSSIPPGGYLVIYCDDQIDGGVADGLHARFKLNGGKGDEFHLVAPDGLDVDATSFSGDIAKEKSWGRLPDGTGGFIPMTPTAGGWNY